MMPIKPVNPLHLLNKLTGHDCIQYASITTLFLGKSREKYNQTVLWDCHQRPPLLYVNGDGGRLVTKMGRYIEPAARTAMEGNEMTPLTEAFRSLFEVNMGIAAGER